MAGTTPNLGLYLPGGGSTGTWTPDETADIDTLNQNFVDIDDWAGEVGNASNRSRHFYGVAASIGSVTPKDGDTYQESDGNKILWNRVGGNWKVWEVARVAFTPTLTGITLGTGGTSSVFVGVNAGVFWMTFDLTLGTGFSLSDPAMSVPSYISNSHLPNPTILNMIGYYDTSAGATGRFVGAAVANPTNNTIRLQTVASANLALGVLGGTSYFTWASGDRLVGRAEFDLA